MDAVGIILAGGCGTRLHPSTRVVSKQLLPIFDKPLIYYPLNTLLSAGIKEIVIISSPNDLPNFKKLLGNGSRLGVRFKYIVQPKPEGIAQAFLLAESQIKNRNVILILGDNIFYGKSVSNTISRPENIFHKATVFTYQVSNPSDYGVVEVNRRGEVTKIVEKPKNPKSSLAVTGLYAYNKEVVRFAKKLRPSNRGELEITDLNNLYLERNALRVELMPKETAWLDTGTPENMMAAAQFVQVMQGRTGIKIGCIEETCFENGFIGKEELANIIYEMGDNEYRRHLQYLLDK